MDTLKGIVLCTVILAGAAHAATSISGTNRYAYGANVGWIDARGDITNGVAIGEFICSGNAYSANCGWINFGGGSPTNGAYYGNSSANDFGVNVTNGALRGFAYGANVGWINFEGNGNPRINPATGALEGYAYGANIGWISLSNALAFVATDSLNPGPDSDGDGIPDEWELQHATNLTVLGSGDFDGDGIKDRGEYLSDTDAKNSNDFLRITSQAVPTPGTNTVVGWSSRPTRAYRIEKSGSATNGSAYADSGLGLQAPDAGTVTVRSFGDNATTRVYRVKALLPLAP